MPARAEKRGETRSEKRTAVESSRFPLDWTGFSSASLTERTADRAETPSIG